MQNVFLELVKLSLIGSLFAAAVMLVRLVFRKAPKWLFCVLWGVVALRLICPVSLESNISLVPDRLASGQIITNVGNEYIGDVDIIYESNIGYSNAIEAGRQPIYSNEGYYVVTEKDSLEAPKTVGETVYPILSWIWIAGVVLMLAYTAVSYFLLRKKMEEATQLRNNIWQCEQVDSPFVLGFIKPRIYLPYAITDSDMANVIAHEQAHIQRKDHWWKPIGFLLLSIHWFNPVLWLAYILLCRDIEAACDEKVIKHMEKDEMRAYSTALLNCSVHRRRIAACPLAFGETGVKERIKRVMNYKKPAFWIIISAVVLCSVVAVCFLTTPAASSEFAMNGNNVSDLNVDEIITHIRKVQRLGDGNAYTNPGNFSLTIDSDFNWVDSQAVRYFFYKEHGVHSAQVRIFPDEEKVFLTESSEWLEQDQVFLLRHYLDAVKYLPQDEISQMAPADKYLIRHVAEGRPSSYSRVITYTPNGAENTDDWLIHLQLEPLHAAEEGYVGTGEEVIHLFYADKTDTVGDISKLLALVNSIANNPDCAASSNPFTFIEAKKPVYNEILTYGSTAVDFFVEQLRTGENGLQGYIMAVACADITGIGDKDLGADWGTAQEWLALYDKSDKGTIIPPVIATDYISGKQAQLLSFGYTSDKTGQSLIACGIAPYQGDYSDNNTLVLDGESGQNQILLTPKGASFSRYRIYLPDGTVYDDGTRHIYDSLGLRVMYSNQGVCLIAPFQTGEYIYEVVLSWPEQGLTVTYGLKVVMTGEESDYDRALDSVFAAYGDGNPLIAVSLVDKYAIGNAVSHSPRYLFKVENIPNAPIWVEVSQSTGEIIGEVDDPEQWLVDPSPTGNQSNLSGGNNEVRQMTLADVVELSKLGMKLTWEDLKDYAGMDIGSGLYVVKFEIDPDFYLLVGDGKTTGEPMYASLNAVSNGASCDIRQSDVEAFIAENQSDALDYAIYKAIIEHNADGTFPDFPDGFLPTEVHYIYETQTVSGTPVVGQLNHMEETTVYIHYVYGRYSYSNGELSKVAGNATPAKITFSVDPEKGYVLKEFWEPNGGSTYAQDIRNHFPKDVADIVLDPQSNVVDTEQMEHACMIKIQTYISSLTD